MEEDSKWLAQNEQHWNYYKNRFDSVKSERSELSDPGCSDSTTTSVYEDACGGKSDDQQQHLSLPKQSSQSLNKSDQHLYSKI